MTLADIKDAICFYLQQPSSSLVQGSTDMILFELNRARRKVERKYDLYLTVDSASVTLGASGVDLTTLTGSSGRYFKTPLRFWLSSGGCEYPIPFYTQGQLFNKRLKSARRTGVDVPERYRSDISHTDYLDDSSRTPRLYIKGTKLFHDPPLTSPTTISLKADFFTWLPAYTAYTASDIFVEHAPDYLQWETIARLNNRTASFIERAEGNPPLKGILMNAQDGLEGLLEHDVTFGEQHCFID